MALRKQQVADLEGRIAAARAGGDDRRALHLTVEGYGQEVLSFLAAIHGSQQEAAEVFSQACEDLVRSLDRFRGHCSMRTWIYALSRNASRRYLEEPFRRRRTPLSAAREVAETVRTITAAYLQSAWKDRLRALRDQLAPEDRALLVLRVDRGLAWDDIARVLDGGELPGLSSATVRKRFERLKARLREQMLAAGPDSIAS